MPSSVCNALCDGEIYTLPATFGPIQFGLNVPEFGATPPALRVVSKLETTMPLEQWPGCNPANASSPAYPAYPGVAPFGPGPFVYLNNTRSASSQLLIQAGEFAAKGGSMLLESVTRVKQSSPLINGLGDPNPYTFVFGRQLKTHSILLSTTLRRYNTGGPGSTLVVFCGIAIIGAASWASPDNFAGGLQGDIAAYTGPFTLEGSSYMMNQANGFFTGSSLGPFTLDLIASYAPQGPNNPNGPQSVQQDTSISIPVLALYVPNLNPLSNWTGDLSILAAGYEGQS